MLHEYARLILSLTDTQFILLTVGTLSFVGILIAYLCARKYFAKNFDKPYSIRVVPSAFIFALYSFLLTLVAIYISGSIYAAFHDGGGGSVLMFFMVFWSIPASIAIFIIGLFIFGLKKVDPVKLVPLQHLNKTEKGVVWVYVLILTIFIFLTYLTKAYIPFMS